MLLILLLYLAFGLCLAIGCGLALYGAFVVPARRRQALWSVGGIFPVAVIWLAIGLARSSNAPATTLLTAAGLIVALVHAVLAALIGIFTGLQRTMDVQYNPHFSVAALSEMLTLRLPNYRVNEQRAHQTRRQLRFHGPIPVVAVKGGGMCAVHIRILQDPRLSRTRLRLTTTVAEYGCLAALAVVPVLLLLALPFIAIFGLPIRRSVMGALADLQPRSSPAGSAARPAPSPASTEPNPPGPGTPSAPLGHHPPARNGRTEAFQLPPSANIQFLSGPLAGRVIPVGMGAILGREAQAAHVVIRDVQVSASHAWIGPHGLGFSFVDRGSTNGSFVNERPARAGEPVQLQHGDVIVLGKTGDIKFIFRRG